MNLNQVTVPSINIERSIAFYRTLGLKLIVQSPHYARFICPDGNSTFSIHQASTLPTGEGISVYFECDDLDKHVLDLKEKGLVFDEDPNDKVWLWREAYVKDPDGNQIVLFWAGENRLNPPWKIKE